MQPGKIHASSKRGRVREREGGTDRNLCPTVTDRLKLERAQETQRILLLLRTQLSEVADDAVGFRAGTGVFLDGLEKIRGAAVV